MKHLKPLFTALLLLCTTVATAHQFEVGGIYYNILSETDKTVEVTYRDSYYYDDDEYTGSVVIPESVTYNGNIYSVTSIGSIAFSSCSGLTNITIPNSVTSIGYGAFFNCSGLTSITIPNSVTSIRYEAFEDCRSLKELRIEDGEGTLSLGYNIHNSYSTGEGLFYDCPLETLYLGRNLSYDTSDSYGYSPFYNIETLANVTIGKNVTTIGSNAFSGCSGLTSIVIPNSVTSIFGYAFYGCTGLKTVYNFSNLIFYKDSSNDGYVAYYATKVINAPNTVIDGDFIWCNLNGANTLACYLGEVAELTLPADYNGENYVIGNDAFNGCTGLTSIEIPNSVTSIGSDAFNGCTGLKTVYNFSNLTFSKGSGYDGYVAYYADNVYNVPNGFIDSDFIWYENEDGMALAGYLGNATEITLPDNYNGENYTIGNSAFSYCDRLKSITIPNSVISIGYEAFAYCTGLTSVVIGNSVTSIGYEAFAYCTGLTSITIPNSVTSIVEGAFYNCTGLTSVVIGNSVTSIGSSAFSGCTGLTSIEIPNSVTSIGNYAFSSCSGITSITIPNSVTSIGYDAFNGCTGLTSIEIPNSVTSIGYEVFAYCTGLTSITIPNSVTSIGDYAFYNCTGLKTVYNFSNLTFSKGSSRNGYVAYYADKVYNAPNGFIDGDFIWYENEDGMTLTGYLGNATELALPADYNGKSVTSIESYALYNCTGLTSIEIPNSVTSIGNYTFYGCTELTSITIPNSVTSIGASAFEGCNNIEKLYIGSSVESIGDKAFTGCEKITEIKVDLGKPIRGSADIFTNAVYDNATLYIPNGTEQLYQKREPWNLFFYIAEMDFTGIDEVYDEVKGENGEVKTIYDLQGRKVEVPSEGLYIIDGKKVMIK